VDFFHFSHVKKIMPKLPDRRERGQWLSSVGSNQSMAY